MKHKYIRWTKWNKGKTCEICAKWGVAGLVWSSKIVHSAFLFCWNVAAMINPTRKQVYRKKSSSDDILKDFVIIVCYCTHHSTYAFRGCFEDFFASANLQHLQRAQFYCVTQEVCSSLETTHCSLPSLITILYCLFKCFKSSSGYQVFIVPTSIKQH